MSTAHFVFVTYVLWEFLLYVRYNILLNIWKVNEVIFTTLTPFPY